MASGTSVETTTTRNERNWEPLGGGGEDDDDEQRDDGANTTKQRKTSLLFSDDNDSEQEEKRRRDSRRRHARKIAPDDESELKLKENVKKTPYWSKIQSVRFIGEKMSHKGVGVIAKTTVPAITELVREYVKVEVSGEYESLKAAKASLTEKALEVEARNAFLRKEEEENRRNKLLKQAKAKNGDNNNISSKAKEGELEDEDEYSISSETWERVEKQIEKTAIGQVRNILKPTQFGGVEKRNSYVHYKLLSTHTVSQHFNHSCHPNCAVSNTVDEAYIRRGILRKQFGFECHCLRCEDEAKVSLTAKISTVAKPPTDPRWFYMPCSNETGFEKLFDLNTGELSIDASLLMIQNGHRKNRRHRRRNHHKSDQDEEEGESSSSSSSMYEEDDDFSSDDDEYSHDSDESDTSASEDDELLRWNESRRTKYSRRYKFAKAALSQKLLTPIQVYRFMRKALMRDDHWQAFVTREAVLDYVKDCDDESSDGVELFKLLLMHCRSSMRIFPNSPHFAQTFATLESMYQLNKKTLNANLSKRWKFRLEVVRESVHPDVLSWNNPKFLNR
ncbi:unnamed protein product [Bathycoccus prasinos]